MIEGTGGQQGVVPGSALVPPAGGAQRGVEEGMEEDGDEVTHDMLMQQQVRRGGRGGEVGTEGGGGRGLTRGMRVEPLLTLFPANAAVRCCAQGFWTCKHCTFTDPC